MKGIPMERHMRYALVASEGIVCAVAVYALSGCGSGNEAAEESVATQTAPLVTSSREEWRSALLKTRPPKKGCFQAKYPGNNWEEVPCGPPAPERTARPESAPLAAASGPGLAQYLVGSGTTYQAQVTGTTGYATGLFPYTHGVSSVTSSQGQDDHGVYAGSYGLQINTNLFSTSTCDGHAGCQGWQQFIFANDALGTWTGLVIEYWMFGYGSSCPPGGRWDHSGSVDCVWNSYIETGLESQPIVDLYGLRLTGAAWNGDPLGYDEVVLETPDGIMHFNPGDSVFPDLAQHWNLTEFNVFGATDGQLATFNTDATITVQIEVAGTSTGSPTCLRNGRNGVAAERNNLNLTLGSCCPYAPQATTDATPAIRFTESNDASVEAPFCLLNDIIPINSLQSPIDQ